MAGDGKKVAVNGTTSSYDPTTQDQITLALVQSGGVKRIQQNLQQRLEEAGWAQNLRDYAERLFRTGEAVSYDDAVKILSGLVSVQSAEEDPRATVNGGTGTGAPDLILPRQAVKDSADFVKKELAKVVQMEEKKP